MIPTTETLRLIDLKTDLQHQINQLEKRLDELKEMLDEKQNKPEPNDY